MDTCASRDEERRVACSGYIAGVTDSYINSQQFCIPPSTDPREITLFTKEYMFRNRNIQREAPVQIILYALRARWPCINSGPRFQFRFRGF